jgi:hypothetical protein
MIAAAGKYDRASGMGQGMAANANAHCQMHGAHSASSRWISTVVFRRV